MDGTEIGKTLRHEASVVDRCSRQFNAHRIWSIISSVIPATLLSIFCVVHVNYWIETGSVAGLGFAIQEAILVVLFIVRRPPLISSSAPLDWTVAIVGSWGGLLFQPTNTPLFGLGSTYMVIQFVGAAFAVVGTYSLGRSFGIVAANRGVKTGAAYSIVRHPIYAAYLLTMTSYILVSPTLLNIAIATAVLGCQLLRIRSEEALLSLSPEYSAYAKRVRYRLIPYVY